MTLAISTLTQKDKNKKLKNQAVVAKTRVQKATPQYLS